MAEEHHETGRLTDARLQIDDPLGLEPVEMRELGYWVVDRVVEHFERMAEEPAIRTGSPADLRALLGGPLPEDREDARAAMQTLVEVALATMQHGDHPRYFARVPGPPSFVGVLGEWLATGFNAMAAAWSGGSGPSTLELVALDWLRSPLGMPAGSEGVMTSGGSLANMTALAAARNAVGPGVCYLSDQTHASIPRALAVLGFPAKDIRVLESDQELRLPLDGLTAAVHADRAAGRRPGFVVATAGTTNTGAVDPLPALAEFCRAEDLWFHIDGAYGASAALCEAGRQALAGIGEADSLVLDPHKWLFQPYDLGCLLVRRPGALKQAFQMNPDYLVDVTGEDEEVDLRDRGPELTRRARGAKLWLSLRVYGLRRLAAAIEHGIALAQYAQHQVEDDPAWEVVTPAQLGIVTFARREQGHDHQALAAGMAREGYATLTSTRLRGRSVLRLCTINPRTTTADIGATLERLGVHAWAQS